MTDCLVIFAAGKSSRFGGFPKAFCDVGRMKNVENTIFLAQPHFEKVYLVINKETLTSGIADGLHADVISIVTGQGDADSILKATKLIQEEVKTDIIAACWGDAVFLTDEPFREMEAGISAWASQSPALVGCAVDPHPYAWFDSDGKNRLLHFKKESPIHARAVFTTSPFLCFAQSY